MRFLAEFFEQRIEIAAGEGPLEGLGGLLIAILESHELVLERGEVRKVVGREELALDDGEIDLDLVEPAGVDRSVDEDDVGPFGAQPSGGALATVRRTIVGDPEYAPRGAVGLLAHDLSDETFEGSDAGLALAAAEQLGAMDIPGRDIGPSTGATVFVLNINRPPRPGRQRGMFAPARLDAGLLVGAEHIIARSQGFVPPPALIEVQDAAGLGSEGGITRENPATMAPRSQRVLAEPAPQRGAADLRHQPLFDRFPAQFGERPARQWQATTRRQLTCQRLDLDPDSGGKNAPGDRRAAVLRDRTAGGCKNVDAIC